MEYTSFFFSIQSDRITVFFMLVGPHYCRLQVFGRSTPTTYPEATRKCLTKEAGKFVAWNCNGQPPAQTPPADLALPPGRSCHLPCLLPLPPLSRPSSPHHCQVLVGSTKGNRSDEHFFLHLHHPSHNVRSGGVAFLVLYSLLVLLLGAPLLLLELRLGPSLHVHVSPLIWHCQWSETL